MSTDPSIREDAFPYFINEATDLLQEIEQDLLSLREDQSAAQVHSLMRSAHTLKGAAATVGLETVKHVCHVLEDVFRGLYNPDIEIDDEIEALLFEGYDCLRTPLMAEINGLAIDDSDIMDRAAAVISRIQEKLGDLFDSEAAIPTAEELGFDVVQSMFEAGVEQRLSALEAILESASTEELVSQTQTMAEVFLGLAESLQLPGFGAIAQTAIQGFSEQPALGHAIVKAAYEDFRAGQKQVLAGDRSQGGEPSAALLALVAGQSSEAPLEPTAQPLPVEANAALDVLGAGLEDLFGAAPIAEGVTGAGLISELGNPELGNPELGNAAALEPESLDSQVEAPELQATAEIDSQLEGLFGHPLMEDPELEPVEDPVPENAATEGPAVTEAEPAPLTSLDNLFGDVDLGAIVPMAQANVTEASSEIPAGEMPQESTADANEPGPKDTAKTADSQGEVAANGDSLTSLDNLFGGIDLSTFETPPLPQASTAESSVAESLAEIEPVEQASVVDSSLEEPKSVQFQSDSVQSAPSQANQSQAAKPQAAKPQSSKPSNSKPRSVKGRTLTGRTTAAKVPSTGSAGTGRASQVNVRVGFDQVLRLDHLVGELLTNQIQTTEEDEQVRSGVRELLDQLRQHRRTLSDLQSAAQQVGLDDWELDPRLKSSQIKSSRAGGQGFLPRDSKKSQKAKAKRKAREEKALTSPVSIPQLSLGAQFDALELDRYSDLHILTQKALNEAVQLEIVIEAVEQMTKRTRQTRDLRHRLFCQLRDDLASVRLKPISELFNRFPRVIQQLSTTYGKKVELTLTGSHVLVDKVTLDSLYDSLLHLVRNGFDHGIEDSEHRLAAGKPAEGRLELRAYQQGNRTMIEIRDDGRGIDPERIAAKAIEKGLIDATQTTEFSEAEILDFLFHSGFSTAAQLSELSGRGVGLDVVRAQIEKLEGSISIRSEVGQGTTFILSLPLSVTVTKQLICKSHDSTYAIAADSIQQVVLPRHSQLRDLGDGRLVFELSRNGELEQIPVQSLSNLLQYAHGLPGAANTLNNTVKPILLLETLEGQRGIQVDQVVGEQEVSIRSLGSAIAAPDYIQGCTVLGDSKLALAIEPGILLAQTYESAEARNIAIGIQSAAEKSRATRLLIIDDSLTQRRTLERTLQTVGYEVKQAEDGLDAIVNLKQDPEIDLIVCDLEMPRMNGFEFISQTRTLSRISQIPIVILTSRSGGKYRQLAMELGASAFLSKPYTDFELLNQVSALLQQRKLAGQSSGQQAALA